MSNHQFRQLSTLKVDDRIKQQAFKAMMIYFHGVETIKQTIFTNRFKNRR